jgi:DNA repair exonuclease SbcCD ATPase subunit
MKIRKLQLKNIGVFDNETIKFQPCPAKVKAEIHIFTGQNGSGKSTLLILKSSLTFSNFLTK